MVIIIIVARLLSAFMNSALYFHNLAIVNIEVESNNKSFGESSVVVGMLNAVINTKEPKTVLKKMSNFHKNILPVMFN